MNKAIPIAIILIVIGIVGVSAYSMSEQNTLTDSVSDTLETSPVPVEGIRHSIELSESIAMTPTP